MSEINQKLQPVVTGSNALEVITITAVDPGSLFSVVCSVSAGATETYSILSHEPALRSAFNLTGDEFYSRQLPASRSMIILLIEINTRIYGLRCEI